MIITADHAVDLLLKKEIVALPTETVYGLAGLATEPEAIAKIFEIKKRPPDNPLICHFYDAVQLEKFTDGISANTKKLLQAFSPGPLSVMVNLKKQSPLLFATCGSGQMIARIPNHEIFLGILQKVGQPLAAPSANTSGTVSPTNAYMVEVDLGNRVSGIVDGGSCEVGIESTIVDARADQEIFILRHGKIGADEIEKVLPAAAISYENSAGTTPGKKYRHYAPQTPVTQAKDVATVFANNDVALILTQEQAEQLNNFEWEELERRDIMMVNLGSSKNIEKMARGFYENIFSIDLKGVQAAFILPIDFGNTSLGKALRERLNRMLGEN